MSKKARKAAAARRLSEKRGRRERNQKLYQDRASNGTNTLSKRQKLNAKRKHQVRTNRNRTESQFPPPKMNDPLHKFHRNEFGHAVRQLTPVEITALLTKDRKAPYNNAREYLGYLSRIRSGEK